MRLNDSNKPPEKSWPAPGKRPATKGLAPSRPQLVTGPRKFVRLNQSTDPQAPPNPDTNPKEVLRHNVARDRLFRNTEFGYAAKAPSGRGRDYWLGLLLGNLILGGLCLFLPQNVVTFLFVAGGMAIYSVGFTWLMFSVSDDY